MISSSSSYSFI